MSLLQTSLKTLKQMKYQVGCFVSELGGGTNYLQRFLHLNYFRNG